MTKNKLFAFLLGAVLTVGTGATATFTTGTALETKAAETTVTYDFVSNFATYASSWGTGYTSHTVSAADLGATEGATITIAHCNKQQAGQTISDRPVIANKVASYTKEISFALTDTSKKLSSVSVEFKQWGTKTPSLQLHDGTELGTSLADLTIASGKTTLTGTGFTGNAFTVAYKGASGSNVQVGLTSITVSYAASTEPTLGLDRSSYESFVGEEFVLTATAQNIDTPTYEWSVTEGEEVVSLSEVAEHPEQTKVTLNAAGEATVQAKVGELTATCKITSVGVSKVADLKNVADGSSVLVEGVVGDNLYGKAFSLYDEDGTGINIYTTTDILTNKAVAGDKVRISGTLATYKGLRQITNPVIEEKVGTGTYEPKTVTTFTSDSVNDYIKVENALVTSTSTLTLKLGTTVATVYVHNTSSPTSAKNALDELKKELIPNLSTVTVVGTLSCYDSSLQFYLTEQLSITEDPSLLKMFAGMLIDNEMFDCTDTTIGAIYADSWMGLADAYTGALSEAEKTYFKTCTANANGNVVQQAAARYDLVVTKYGLTDFAERNPAAASMNLGLINNTFNPTLIFVIAGIALAASVVTVVIVKKSKKAN